MTKQEPTTWTPGNLFNSKHNPVNEEKFATMSAKEITDHLYWSLFVQRTHSSRPMFHSAGAENFPEARILEKLMDCVAPKIEARSVLGRDGLIGIGQFQMPIADFAAAMVAWHPTFTYGENLKPGEIIDVRDKMADVLGAGNFKSLEILEMIDQSREWLAGAISGAIKREYDQRGEGAEAARASKDVSVWTRMDGVMAGARDAFIIAIEAGAIGADTANQIVMRGQMRAHEKSGLWKDWAPLSTGLLHGMNEAISDLQKQMKKTSDVSPALTHFADALLTASLNYNQAQNGAVAPAVEPAKEGQPSIVPLGGPLIPMGDAIAQLVVAAGQPPVQNPSLTLTLSRR